MGIADTSAACFAGMGLIPLPNHTCRPEVRRAYADAEEAILARIARLVAQGIDVDVSGLASLA